MLTDRGQLQGEGRRAPRTRVDDGGRYLSTPKPKASHRLHQRSTASLTARPSRVPFLTTENTIRRECLNHVLVLGESHLRRILARYFSYYHRARTHLALDKDAPDVRPVELPEAGRIVEIPEVGGLHHRYVRQAA